MQLTGPPKLNGWTAPYCDHSEPLRGDWEDESTYVTYRRGTVERVGRKRMRGRFRLSWRGLSYDTAARILTEVQADPVVLTPRMAVAAEGGLVDLDGDGMPDVAIDETDLPCRVISDLPSTTSLASRTADGRVASLTLELETLQTYEEVPGVTEIGVWELDVTVSGGDMVEVDLLKADGTRAVTSLETGDGRVIQPGQSMWTYEQPGTYTVRATGPAGFESVHELRLGYEVDISHVDNLDLTQLTKVTLKSAGEGQDIDLSRSPYGTGGPALIGRASIIEASNARRAAIDMYASSFVQELYLEATQSAFFIDDVPAESRIVDVQKSDVYGILRGGTFSESLRSLNLERSAVTIDAPSFAPSVPNLRTLRTRADKYDLAALLGNCRDVVEVVDDRFGFAGDLTGTSAAGPYLHAAVRRVETGTSSTIEGFPDDWTQIDPEAAVILPRRYSSGDPSANLYGAGKGLSNAILGPSGLYVNRERLEGLRLDVTERFYRESTEQTSAASTLSQDALDACMGTGPYAEDGLIDYLGSLRHESLWQYEIVALDPYNAPAEYPSAGATIWIAGDHTTLEAAYDDGSGTKSENVIARFNAQVRLIGNANSGVYDIAGADYIAAEDRTRIAIVGSLPAGFDPNGDIVGSTSIPLYTDGSLP